MGRNIIPYQSSERRSGQALILSVLIMVFIVLLGTTFIAIVSSNMSNTARTASKDQARLAAQAGISFADAQLTGSPNGLGWRPELVNPPAAPGDGFYWTALDRAQGWSSPSSFYMTAIGSSTAAEYVKFPNPLQRVSTENASHFMIRVSQVEWDDPDNNSETKTGDIRIESIGFANDDQTAFYRMVAYKKGSASNPLTAAMRSVSNWDFDGNAIPQGTTTVAATGSTLELTNVQGSFSKDDFVTVFDPTSNQMGYGQVSTATTSGTGSTILNVTGLTMATGAGTVVQRAAQLGIPDAFGIDYDNDTTTPNTPVDFRISGLKNTVGTDVNTSGSVWVNGGLVWYGQNHATNLVAPSPTNIASNILVSGVFASSAGASVQATDSTGTVNAAIPATSIDTGFTGNTTVTSGLLNDGYNRMRGSLDPTRQVHSFTPPDITAGGDGFGRYRQLTQYSPSIDVANPQASAYGYGHGIYINNPTDVEMKPKSGSLVPMEQEDLQKMWFTPSDVNSKGFQRLQEPEDPAGMNLSLEQQHMRGWVSPDQFLPRGAEVIINNDDTITVNLDPLEDNSTTYPHANFASSAPTPDPSKGWRNLDGSLAGDTTSGGVYSHTFNWPVNGTLFAEGNIRIRGVNNSAPSSLTVVSMNNIYIDGSLKLSNPTVGNPKVLLLAKKNVIVNPTLALAPVQAVTTLSGDSSAATDTISVNDTSNFKEGDYITFAYNNAPVRRITSIGTGSITVDAAFTASAAAARGMGYPVYTVFDPKTDDLHYSTTYQPYTTALRLTKFSNAIQRRVSWPPQNVDNYYPDGDIRLAFRHSAEYRKALEVGINNIPVPADPTKAILKDAPPTSLTNKINSGATTPEDIVQSTNKTVNVTYSQEPASTPDPGVDQFVDPAPVDQADAEGKTLDALVAEFLAKHPVTQWHYDNIKTKVDNGFNLVPYYYLASAGSRYPFKADSLYPVGDPNHIVKPVLGGTPNPYLPSSEPSQPVYPEPKIGGVETPMHLPMATSVQVFVNSVQSTLAMDPFSIVRQLGFNPIFMDATPLNEAEDVLTTDQYFYQPHVKSAPDTNYPYYYPGVENDLTKKAYKEQNTYDSDSDYTLDSRSLGSTSAGDNEIVLQLNDAVQGYFPTTGPENRTIPYYRLSNLKLQNEVFDGATHALGTGTTFDINAYVYAQEGGWYVIPGAEFDEDVKNGDDLNRDGVISQGESIAAYRYNRYNYQIVFTGAIMENRTASPADVEKWTDKWATVKMDDLAIAPTYVSGDPATSNLNTILYYYDPAAAQSALDAGFHVPVANGELIYQG